MQNRISRLSQKRKQHPHKNGVWSPGKYYLYLSCRCWGMAQLRKKIQGQERGVTLGSSAVPSSAQRLLPASHCCCKTCVLTNCALQSICSAALWHSAERGRPAEPGVRWEHSTTAHHYIWAFEALLFLLEILYLCSQGGSRSLAFFSWYESKSYLVWPPPYITANKNRCCLL